MNTVARLTAAAVMVTTGWAGTGSMASARADDAPWPPWPFVGYYWCPPQPFDPAWGPNWEPTTCHDAHHRDLDGTIHTFDYWGPSPFQDWPEIPNTRP
ncbi:hypothetical protein [Mycobacterium helveticum]|uniref:Pilin n=1 Tax=Mycobacterium helveticum TaxID=2592811 RepID=A0A557XSE9_9MYCO|nr:hypothetical protein FPZ46_05685 [Mycobacterium helveticum]TVS88862.1 hypothetical protein FPZ47_12915 [Mycobacterium helveticum]